MLQSVNVLKQEMQINNLPLIIQKKKFLTIVDPVAQIARPLPLVQERHKRVNVGSARATPDDGTGCHHRKLLQVHQCT